MLLIADGKDKMGEKKVLVEIFRVVMRRFLFVSFQYLPVDGHNTYAQYRNNTIVKDST